MDLYYLNNMSILLDLQIILKTGAAIARQLFESHQAAQRGRQMEALVRRQRPSRKANSPLSEIARVIVRRDHVASVIVNANHSIISGISSLTLSTV